MLIIALDAIFAAIFLHFTRITFLRAHTFLRSGWQILQTATAQPDYRHNIEARRDISTAGRFLIGGIFWGVACVACVYFCIFFSLQLLRLYF